jgi:hypothetical protein
MTNKDNTSAQENVINRKLDALFHKLRVKVILTKHSAFGFRIYKREAVRSLKFHGLKPGPRVMGLNELMNF